MSHIVESCRSPDKTEWRLISATLCGSRLFFMADQLWFMTRIREEEEAVSKCANTCPPIYTYESANIQFQIFVTVYSEITENMCIIIQLVIGTPQPRQQ